MGEKGKKILPMPEIEHPGIKEDTECMIGVMSEDSDTDKRDLHISSYVYPSLMTHNVISIQPWKEGSILLSGRGNSFWYEINELSPNAPEPIKLAKMNLKFFDPNDKDSFISDLAVSAVNGWDQFIIEQLEQLAGIKNYAFSVWGSGIIDQLSLLKENVERNSGLPVTWVIINYKILSSLQNNHWYIPYVEERQYVSGYLSGRWKHADVYCVENMPRDTIALMGYKGNMPHDSPFVVSMGKILYTQEGRKSNILYGSAEVLPGWEDSRRAVGKLQIG